MRPEPGAGTDTGPGMDWYADPAVRAWVTDAAPSGAPAEYHRTLPGYAPTPLVEVSALAAALGVGRLFVKDESKRFDLGAFKVLGASWAVEQALAARPATDELVTATDGNHGRGVARVARLRGLPATVFMPGTVPPIVIERVRAEGASVHVLAGDYDAAVATARDHAAPRPGALLVQDTAWPGYEQVPAWIVEGYETLFAELDAQLAAAGARHPSLIAVPVGVGSLAQAAVAHYRAPDWRAAGRAAPALLSVEPDSAACVLASLRAGAAAPVPTAGTIMNGLNCGTPSTIAWPLIAAGMDAAIAVTDAACRSAMAELGAHGIGSGPSGAASYTGIVAALTGAGAEARRSELGLAPDATVVALSTEGPLV
ncbi:MAG TPA: pyridoxal-phosphate dependent enzyme [Gryllotalpicola sp.]